jgi:hypothetical protein
MRTVGNHRADSGADCQRLNGPKSRVASGYEVRTRIGLDIH